MQIVDIQPTEGILLTFSFLLPHVFFCLLFCEAVYWVAHSPGEIAFVIPWKICRFNFCVTSSLDSRVNFWLYPGYALEVPSTLFYFVFFDKWMLLFQVIVITSRLIWLTSGSRFGHVSQARNLRHIPMQFMSLELEVCSCKLHKKKYFIVVPNI